MSQLQRQGHRLPKTWSRRPGSSDPTDSTFGVVFGGMFFLGGVEKKTTDGETVVDMYWLYVCIDFFFM